MRSFARISVYCNNEVFVCMRVCIVIKRRGPVYKVGFS